MLHLDTRDSYKFLTLHDVLNKFDQNYLEHLQIPNQDFIDSFLNNILYNFPHQNFFINRLVDSFEIIDGKKRISTLYNYINCNICVKNSEINDIIDVKYNKLERRRQRKIEECGFLVYYITNPKNYFDYY